MPIAQLFYLPSYCLIYKTNTVVVVVVLMTLPPSVLPFQIIEALDANCIDKSEVLTCAVELHHIEKRAFNISFVYGAKRRGIHI